MKYHVVIEFVDGTLFNQSYDNFDDAFVVYSECIEFDDFYCHVAVYDEFGYELSFDFDEEECFLRHEGI